MPRLNAQRIRLYLTSRVPALSENGNHTLFQFCSTLTIDGVRRFAFYVREANRKMCLQSPPLVCMHIQLKKKPDESLEAGRRAPNR